jgi:hypothetical protein
MGRGTSIFGNLIAAINSVTGNPEDLKSTDGAGHVSQRMSGASLLAALGSTSLIVTMMGTQIPASITLKSSDATRKIEFSVDGGTEYFQPVYDVTSATMLVAVANSGLSHVRFTGLTTDTWSKC